MRIRSSDDSDVSCSFGLSRTGPASTEDEYRRDHDADQGFTEAEYGRIIGGL